MVASRGDTPEKTLVLRSKIEISDSPRQSDEVQQTYPATVTLESGDLIAPIRPDSSLGLPIVASVLRALSLQDVLIAIP